MAFSHGDARGKSRTILASTLVRMIGRTATHDMHDRSMRGTHTGLMLTTYRRQKSVQVMECRNFLHAGSSS
jgi:hypothetical protein